MTENQKDNLGIFPGIFTALFLIVLSQIMWTAGKVMRIAKALYNLPRKARRDYADALKSTDQVLKTRL